MAPLSFIKTPFSWLSALTRYRGTHAQGPNFAFDHCVKRITAAQRAQLDLRCLEVLGNGAEPINPKVMFEFLEAFEPLGLRREAMCPCYGLAEATLMVSSSRKHSLPTIHRMNAEALELRRVVPAEGDVRVRDVVGCGPPVSDRVVLVDPETNRPCGPDEVGEIWVSDPCIAKGYWRKPEKSEQTFGARLADSGEGPFLRTGDLGFVRAGELCIVGRIKDLIIVRGANFYPQDIEWTVQRCHRALDLGSGAAVPVIAGGDERLVILHELTRGLDPGADLAEVVFAIRQAVAEAYDIRTYAVCLLRPGTIPKTSSGKIQRHACRHMFESGAVDSVMSWIEGLPPNQPRRQGCAT
jgi:acyl-CoA synthetase (AMP-forming)/AMP-acid ligase II